MGDEEFSRGEKTIIRNQRLIMLALLGLMRDQGRVGSAYHADNLLQRVRSMEHAWEWIASPGERIV